MSVLRGAVDPSGKFSVSKGASSQPEKPAPKKRKAVQTSSSKRKRPRKAPTVGMGGFRGGV